MSFDDALTRYAIPLMALVCAFTAAVVCWASSKFKTKALPTVLLAVATVPISIATGSFVAFLLALNINPAGTISTAANDPTGALAFFVETGIEISIGLPLSIAALIFFQVRRRSSPAA